MMKNTIIFSSNNPSVEVLRLSKDGIWANPDIPADDAAKLVLSMLDNSIKSLVQKAVEKERDACVQIVENEAFQYASPVWAFEIVNDIKARGSYD
jgi:hypothetical protein